MGCYTAEQAALNLINKSKGYDAIWQVILSFRQKAFTSNDIAGQMQSSQVMIKEFLNKLVLHNFIEITEEISGLAGQGARKKYIYRLITSDQTRPKFNSEGKIINPKGTGADQMWRCMKMIKVFTSKDLAIAASTDEKTVSHGYAKNYIRALTRAGYLKIINKPNAAKGVSPIYRLLPQKNTGPNAPVLKRDQSVFDPNLKKLVWPLESEGQS